MKLKHGVLAQMGRDLLKAAVDDLSLDGVDRRSAADMEARLSRAHRATPEFLVAYLNRKQVKGVCETIGLPARGRRKQLIASLLEHSAPRRRRRAFGPKAGRSSRGSHSKSTKGEGPPR